MNGLFAAHLDESFDSGNAGVYVVACVVGDGWNVLKGEKFWSATLSKHGFKVFKANLLKNRPHVVAEFAQAIVDSGLIACGIIGNQSEVLQALKGTPLHARYRRSPYMLLYQQTFVNIAMDFRERGAGRHVAFVCDESSVYRDLIPRAYQDLCELNPLSAPYMGSCTMKSDEDCIPLQMADLVASEIRRRGLDFLRDEGFSPALDLLMRHEKIWSLRYMNGRALKLVRELAFGEPDASSVSGEAETSHANLHSVQKEARHSDDDAAEDHGVIGY